jgi:hypothetical protein
MHTAAARKSLQKRIIERNSQKFYILILLQRKTIKKIIFEERDMKNFYDEPFFRVGEIMCLRKILIVSILTPLLP